MMKRLQRRFALSKKGAWDVIWGSVACAFQNVAFMLPMALLYQLVADLVNQRARNIVFYIAGCVFCAVLILLTTYLQYNGTFLATYRETKARRISLAEKLRKIPLSFFEKKDLSDLTSAIMNDCRVLEESQSHFVPPLIGSFLSTILIAIVLLFMNWKMALAALWVLPISLCIVGFSSRVQKRLAQKASRARLSCEEGIQECLEAMPDLRSNNAEDRYRRGLEKKIHDLEDQSARTEFRTAAFITSANLLLKLGIATTALVGVGLLIRGEIDIVTYFLYLLAVSRLYDPMEGSLQNLSAVIQTNANIERMNEILEHPLQSGSAALSHHGYDIVFDHVGFAYDNGETVLQDVSFTAKQGEVTALVGPSGGGKTTVSRLIARFWDISKGTITVGDMNIAKVDPETLMSLYSIVFQEVTLFNNTIFENIRIGNPNATDEEVIEAGKLANVDVFAEKLPNGWNSLIGENGCQLSGGERQRISIARAFLKNAPIILLDEATASLDVDNETLIQQALSRLIQDKTVLLIAHRMRTVVAADKIVVLADGYVAEEGSPSSLLAKEGIFARMNRLQIQGQNWSMNQ